MPKAFRVTVKCYIFTHTVIDLLMRVVYVSVLRNVIWPQCGNAQTGMYIQYIQTFILFFEAQKKVLRSNSERSV